jgi:hypothetical protein
MHRPQNKAELETYVLQILSKGLQGKLQLASIPSEIVHDALNNGRPATISEDAYATQWQKEFCLREAMIDCMEDDGDFKFRRQLPVE